MPAASRSTATSRICCTATTARRWHRDALKATLFSSGLPRGSDALDAQIVLNVRHARSEFRQVLGAALEAAARDGAVEGDLAVLYDNLDVRGIDQRVLRQALAHILMDALV